MKKRLPLFVLLLAVILLPTCTKLREYIEHQPSDIGKYCRIELMTVKWPDPTYTPTAHFQVTYNRAGNPQEMVQLTTDTIPFESSTPDLHFRYDSKGRLTDVLFTDPFQTFVWAWDRYTYSDENTIIDSIFYYDGDIRNADPWRTSGNASKIDIIHLDRAGRPTQIHTYWSNPSEEGSDLTITYDARGNRILPGVQYDDKINVYQTNKAWQLYFRQYSRNNPLQAVTEGSRSFVVGPTEYNKFGLPTHLVGADVYGELFRMVFATMDVQYSCDVPDGPIGK